MENNDVFNEDKMFIKAEMMFNEIKYDESFNLFKSIANNITLRNSIRAEAFNMLGVIVSSCAPYLFPEDETGLTFYLQSIAIYPNCLSALLNIVHSYDPLSRYGDMHNNENLFNKCLTKLIEELNHLLSNEEVTMLADIKSKHNKSKENDFV